MLVVLVSGFSIVPGFNEQLTILPKSIANQLNNSDFALVRGVATLIEEASRPAGLVLIISGLIAAVYLIREALKMEKVARERMFVVFVLTFVSILFWALFEQQGSSLNAFTDRNVDRVREERVVELSDVGQEVELRLVVDTDVEALQELRFLSQEYLGHRNGSDSMKGQIEEAIRAVEMSKDDDKKMASDELEQLIAEVTRQERLSMTALTYLREFAKSEDASPRNKKVRWTYVEDSIGQLGIGGSEIPASVFQSVNSIYIMLFGVVLTCLWDLLAKKGLEPSTPVKFSLALLQVGLGFGFLYVGALTSDADGMVGLYWLLLAYLMLTTGELCLSPVGLSMVTKLSPGRLVSTVMGSWFLALAFAQFLGAIIAQFTASSEGEQNIVPIPIETVHNYGDVYQTGAIMAAISGVVCLIAAPTLKKWMHLDLPAAGHDD